MHISKTAVACTVITGLMVAGAAIAEDGTGSVGVDVVSAYVFRGGTVNDEINVNPTAEATVRGITIGTWGNFNTDISEFDEVDLYAGYDLPLKDAPIAASLGYTEYIYPGLAAVAEDGTVFVNDEADRELSTTLSPSGEVMFSPSLFVGYGIQGPFLDDGLYLELSGSHEIPVSGELSVEAGAKLGYEAGDNFAENGLSHLTLSLGTGVGPANVSVNYVVETDEDVLTVDEDLYFSVGMSL